MSYRCMFALYVYAWSQPALVWPRNTKEGSITVQLTYCLTGLDYSVLQIKTKNISCHTTDSKPVEQEVNCTVILPPLVFPGVTKLQGYTVLYQRTSLFRRKNATFHPKSFEYDLVKDCHALYENFSSKCRVQNGQCHMESW